MSDGEATTERSWGAVEAPPLAYVFWHWPAPAVSVGAYERALLAFHEALAAARLPGVSQSVACHVEGSRWLPERDTAYEDWYLVAGFGDLATLNEGAVAGSCRTPHDEVARLAGGGTAGLYRLARGAERRPAQPFALWLPKPVGMSYAGFFERIRPWTRRDLVGLWQRQMVLGPAPEFCLLGPEPPDLDLPAVALARRRVLRPRL